MSEFKAVFAPAAKLNADSNPKRDAEVARRRQCKMECEREHGRFGTLLCARTASSETCISEDSSKDVAVIFTAQRVSVYTEACHLRPFQKQAAMSAISNRNGKRLRMVTIAVALWGAAVVANERAGRTAPEARVGFQPVGHRGLIQHAPENTLAGFAACIGLKIGFELDVRRTRDGRLVCIHDATVARTTNGTG